MAGMSSVQYCKFLKFPLKLFIFRTTLNKKFPSLKYDFLKQQGRKNSDELPFSLLPHQLKNLRQNGIKMFPLMAYTL